MPPHDEYKERHVKTKRAVSPRGDVVYASDVERSWEEGDADATTWVTESHNGGAQAACGCVIGGDVKPRFHADGTLVCTAHYLWCGACGAELLPTAAAVVEKKVYCRQCGERAIDVILETERRQPGSFDRALLAHLRLQRHTLRMMRWKAGWDRLFGRRQELLPPRR